MDPTIADLFDPDHGTPLLNATGWPGGVCLIIAILAMSYGVSILLRRKGSMALYGLLSVLPVAIGVLCGFLNLTMALRRLGWLLSGTATGFWEPSGFARVLSVKLYIGFVGAALTVLLLLFGMFIAVVEALRKQKRAAERDVSAASGPARLGGSVNMNAVQRSDKCDGAPASGDRNE